MNQSQAPASETIRFDVFTTEIYKGAGGEERTYWTNVGVAFPHKDGNGFNVQLRAVPFDGRLVLLKHEPRNDDRG